MHCAKTVFHCNYDRRFSKSVILILFIHAIWISYRSCLSVQNRLLRRLSCLTKETSGFSFLPIWRLSELPMETLLRGMRVMRAYGGKWQEDGARWNGKRRWEAHVRIGMSVENAVSVARWVDSLVKGSDHCAKATWSQQRNGWIGLEADLGCPIDLRP